MILNNLFKNLIKLIFLSFFFFNNTFAESFIYLKNQSGQLAGTVIYEPGFFNSIKLQSYCFIRSWSEGITCEYLNENSPIATDPVKAINIINKDPNITPEEINKIKGDINEIAKKINLNLKTPKSVISQLPINNPAPAPAPTPEPTQTPSNAPAQNPPNPPLQGGQSAAASTVVPTSQASTNNNPNVVYQVIERAVPGPQGPAGPQGPQGPAGGGGYSAPQISYIPGAQYNGYVAATETGDIDVPNINVSNSATLNKLSGAGLVSCNLTLSKIVYNSTTKLFECSVDQSFSISGNVISSIIGDSNIIVAATSATATINLANNISLGSINATGTSYLNAIYSTTTNASTTNALTGNIINLNTTNSTITNSTSSKIATTDLNATGTITGQTLRTADTGSNGIFWTMFEDASNNFNLNYGGTNFLNVDYLGAFNFSKVINALAGINTSTIVATGTSQFATILASTTNATTSNAATGNFTNINNTNATITNSTSTNLYSQNASLTNATVTNITVTGTLTTTQPASFNSTSTFATTTAASSTITNLSANNAVINNSTSTNIFATNASLTNATSTNLYSTNASITTLTTNSLFSAILNSLLATITTLWGTTSNFAVSNASTTNATTSNTVTANITGTATVGNLLVTGSSTLASTTLTNFVAQVGNVTSLNSGSTTVTGVTASGNFFTTGSSTLGSTTVTNVTGGIAAFTTGFINSLTSLTGTFATSVFSPLGYFTSLYATTTNATTTNTSGLTTTGNLYTTGSSTLASTTIGNTVFTGVTNFATVPNIPLTNGYVWRGSSTGLQEATSSLYINNNGNVGVGTTNTSLFKLSIGGTASTSDQKVGINGTQVLYFPSGFADSSLFIGNGGSQLTHTAGLEGYYNTSVGIRNLTKITTGSYNTSVGFETMENNTTGSYNSVLGEAALINNTTGDSNSALGWKTLLANTTGSGNSTLGYSSLIANITGSNNVAIGYNSLLVSTSTSYEVAVGYSALSANGLDPDLDGQKFNTAIGSFSLAGNTTGQRNTGLGYGSSQQGTTGSDNVAIGAFAIGNNVTGNRNIGIGQSAMVGAIGNSFDNNIGIGYFTGSSCTTCANNILMGIQTGNALTSGQNNIAIGHDVDLPSNTGTGQLNIGNLIYGTSLGTGGTLSTGSVGIGTSSPLAFLHVGAGTDGPLAGATAERSFYGTNNGTTRMILRDSTNDVEAQMAASLGVVILGSVTNTPLQLRTNNTSQLAIDVSGNTTITGVLSISQTTGVGTAGAPNLQIGSAGGLGVGGLFVPAANQLAVTTAATERMRFDASGNVMINATAQVGLGKFGIAYNGGAVRGIAINDTAATAGSQFQEYLSNGTSIGSISNNSNTGILFNTTSDRRKKENISTTTLSIDTLMQLPVRDFSFISDLTHATQTGFIAQELNLVFPDAVSKNGDDGLVPLGVTTTAWAVDYGRITPLIVKAVQDLARQVLSITGAFKVNLITWLASAENGIDDIITKTIHTQVLCVGKHCVNEEQFGNMINNQSNGGSNSGSSWTELTPTATSTSPVVTLNGAATITLDVGEEYEELSATVTDDQDTGLTIVISGSVNTGVADTYTIAYSSTPDTQGNTSNTVTRVVNVVQQEVGTSTTSTTTLP